jgi:hypothetical protein
MSMKLAFPSRRSVRIAPTREIESSSLRQIAALGYATGMSEQHTAAGCLAKATEARATAERMLDASSRRMMLGFAIAYEVLARQAEFWEAATRLLGPADA